MAPTNLNLTALAANAVVPSSGNSYQVLNLGFGHCLDNAFGLPPVKVLRMGIPFFHMGWPTPRRQTSSNGDTVFTLQALSTVQSGSSAVIDGRGGYMRVDPTTNKVVHGGQPQAWKLVQVAPSLYKMAPFEDVFSSNGRLVATDVSATIIPLPGNQLALGQDVSSLQQFWTFN